MRAADAEAKFLESQKARTDSLRQKASRHRKEEALNTFWASLKVYLSSWKDRLEQLSTAHPVAAATEEEKRTVHLEFCELQENLKRLRKNCLSASCEILDENDASAELLPTPPDEMPLTDIRLLHKEFTKCQARMDQVRQKILPRGKFVFRRYRDALSRQEQGRLPLRATSKEVVTASTSTTPKKQSHDGNELKDIKNQVIDIFSDGRVEVKPKDGRGEVTKMKRNEVPTVLRNIENSTVLIHGASQALHLVAVSHSTVKVLQPIQGAVHVTDCHDTVIWLHSQQLRLHESTNLQCHVKVSAGVILEDCSSITFYSSNKSELDVKDFNWLRNGITSPNYLVELEEEKPLLIKSSCMQESSLRGKKLQVSVQRPILPSVPNTSIMLQTNAAIESEKDEDDDEL